jgi:type IV pilus assembly protein PilV
MPIIKRQSGYYQRGTSLLEVLITIVILAFGLLGLAGLQGKIQQAEVESFQRAQATLLLADMHERISVNRDNAANYVSANPIGTLELVTQPADCSGITLQASRDICEWSNALKGASEKMGTNNTGAMEGGRGCIGQVQAPDPSPGVCTPGIYQITVVWQGMNPTAAPGPGLTCGQGLYTQDTTRRAISSQVTVGLPNCI